MRILACATIAASAFAMSGELAPEAMAHNGELHAAPDPTLVANIGYTALNPSSLPTYSSNRMNVRAANANAESAPSAPGAYENPHNAPSVEPATGCVPEALTAPPTTMAEVQSVISPVNEYWASHRIRLGQPPLDASEVGVVTQPELACVFYSGTQRKTYGGGSSPVGIRGQIKVANNNHGCGLEQVVKHEFGHALGQHHTPSPTSYDPDHVMNTYGSEPGFAQCLKLNAAEYEREELKKFDKQTHTVNELAEIAIVKYISMSNKLIDQGYSRELERYMYYKNKPGQKRYVVIATLRSPDENSEVMLRVNLKDLETTIGRPHFSSNKITKDDIQQPVTDLAEAALQYIPESVKLLSRGYVAGCVQVPRIKGKLSARCDLDRVRKNQYSSTSRFLMSFGSRYTKDDRPKNFTYKQLSTQPTRR